MGVQGPSSALPPCSPFLHLPLPLPLLTGAVMKEIDVLLDVDHPNVVTMKEYFV